MSTKRNILEKIKHIPLLLQGIHSYSLNRPFILIDFITNNANMKLRLKNIFQKSKKNNNLSK